MTVVGRNIAIASALMVVAASGAWGQSPASRPMADRLGFWSPTEQEQGYRAMETIFPTNVIHASGKVHALKKAAKELPVAFTYENRPYTTDDFMKRSRVSGLLVIKDGEILLERYGLGRTQADRWTSFSIAKSVTSTLTGIAIRDGKIKSIDDPASHYIPELKQGAYEGVTVRQLLTMSSGAEWDEDYDKPDSDFNLHATETGPDFYRFMAAKKRLHAPGTVLHYSTAESNLLGAVVQNATGKSLSAYFSEKIWKPYGMENDGVWMLSKDGKETGGICFSATLRDYGRLGLFMLDHGQINGRSILPEGWLDEATRTQLPTEYGSGYGYQWWIGSDGVYSGIGIMGQLLRIDPRNKLVIVVQSAWFNSGKAAEYAMVTAFADAATAAAMHD